MKIEKNTNKACFLRFLGSVSRKIGVFFGEFCFCFCFKWKTVKLEFLSRFPLLVFKGLEGFGSPAVDEVCLLKLSLLVGVMELGVRPQRVQED